MLKPNVSHCIGEDHVHYNPILIPKLIVEIETLSTPSGEGYALGETVRYNVNVKNDGNCELYNVIIISNKLSFNTGYQTYTVGQQRSFSLSYSITEDDIINGEIMPDITVDADNDTGEVTDIEGDMFNPEPTDEPNGEIQISVIEVSHPMNAEYYTLGETIEYSVEVFNTGNLTITNITVYNNDETFSETISQLQPSETETFSVYHEVTQYDIENGSFKDEFTATGDSPDPSSPEPFVIPGEEEVPTGE